MSASNEGACDLYTQGTRGAGNRAAIRSGSRSESGGRSGRGVMAGNVN